MTVCEQLKNLAAHNAYHFARIVLLRQLLNTCPHPEEATPGNCPYYQLSFLSRFASISARVRHTVLHCFFSSKGIWSVWCFDPGCDAFP